MIDYPTKDYLVRLIIPFSLATVAAALASVPAFAQDADFQGPRIEGFAGYDQTDVAPGQGAQDGVMYGVRAGYDFDLGRVVIGAEADIAGSEASTTRAGFSSDAERYLSAGLRAGVKITEGLLVFARGGIANARIQTTLGTFDKTGFAIGGGGEIILGGAVFGRGEYRYSDYGDRLRGQQYTVAVGYRF